MERLTNAGDLVEVDSGPTRGDNKLDLIFTNVNDRTKTTVLPPLQSGSGASSDHSCVYMTCRFEKQRDFVWETKLKRERNPAREAAFAADLASWDPVELAGTDDVDDMAGILENKLSRLTDKHFPQVRIRKRSTKTPGSREASGNCGRGN